MKIKRPTLNRSPKITWDSDYYKLIFYFVLLDEIYASTVSDCLFEQRFKKLNFCAFVLIFLGVLHICNVSCKIKSC